MRYDDAKLLDALAREYVLGMLHGRARTRFARLLASSIPARRAVAEWERHFAPLAFAVKPVAPPAAAWSQIETAVGARRPASGAFVWQALAAGLALVAVVLGGLYLGRAPVPEQARYVAVITEDAAGPVWLLQAFAESRELRVTGVNDRPEPAGNSYELWMLPDGGAAPVSLGLIAGIGDTLLRLSPQALTVLEATSTLAVSLEPAGGSPTGQPTGPVIFTAPLIRA